MHSLQSLREASFLVFVDNIIGNAETSAGKHGTAIIGQLTVPDYLRGLVF